MEEQHKYCYLFTQRSSATTDKTPVIAYSPPCWWGVMVHKMFLMSQQNKVTAISWATEVGETQTCSKSKPAEIPKWLVENRPFLYFIYFNFNDFFSAVKLFFMKVYLSKVLNNAMCDSFIKTVKQSHVWFMMIWQNLKGSKPPWPISWPPTLVSVVTADIVHLMLCVRSFLASF